MEELYRYDPRNRLTAYTKGNVTTPFQYDEAGNLLADDKAFYSYDAFNRTVRAETFDGNIQINRYDAEGLRYEMEENGNLVQFIFNPDREAVSEEENGSVIRLVRGSELIARSCDSARTYYHYASDEMGSTTHIVDEVGNIQNRYEYDAWGNIIAQEESVPNRFTYYGQQLDPITQQYYLRARFYNPVIARFAQEDTYWGDGLNLYVYCANNPVYYVDPSGYVPYCMKEAYNKYLYVFQRKYMDKGYSPSEARVMAKQEADTTAKIIYAENQNPTILPATSPNNTAYPPRTANAQMEAQYVAAVADRVFGKGEHPSITTFVHEDKSVSVGFSGNISSKNFKRDVEKLQAALDARHGSTSYHVSSMPVPDDGRVVKVQCPPG